MATRNIDKNKQPAPGKKKPASPDTLVKGGKIDKTELSEDQLKDVSGGPIYMDKT